MKRNVKTTSDGVQRSHYSKVARLDTTVPVQKLKPQQPFLATHVIGGGTTCCSSRNNSNTQLTKKKTNYRQVSYYDQVKQMIYFEYFGLSLG